MIDDGNEVAREALEALEVLEVFHGTESLGRWSLRGETRSVVPAIRDSGWRSQGSWHPPT